MERIRKMLNTMEGTGDMTEKEIQIIQKVTFGKYEGAEADREKLIEQLNAIHGAGVFEGLSFYKDWNLQTVYDILQVGKWFYMEDVKKIFCR